MTETVEQIPELLPCPFCGNNGSGPIEDALHVVLNEHDWRSPSWTVQCDKCTATMGYSDERDEAIAAWNRRPSSEAGKGEALRVLSMLGLQSERYKQDADFRDAVDTGLALTVHARAALQGHKP